MALRIETPQERLQKVLDALPKPPPFVPQSSAPAPRIETPQERVQRILEAIPKPPPFAPPGYQSSAPAPASSGGVASSGSGGSGTFSGGYVVPRSTTTSSTIVSTAGSAQDPAAVQDYFQPIIDQIQQLILSGAQQPDLTSVVRDFNRLLGRLVPSYNVPTFEQAQAQIMESLAPVMESAQRQLSQQYEQAQRRLMGAQAIAGIVGSDPAAKQLHTLGNIHRQELGELQNQFTRTASQEAMNLINQALSGYQYQTQAYQTAADIASQLVNQAIQSQNLQFQGASSLLGLANLMESARQANLPYQYPSASNVGNMLVELLMQMIQGNQLGVLGGW